MKSVSVVGKGLNIVSKAVPLLGPLDVLVKVTYAGVNFSDIYRMRGMFGRVSEFVGVEGAGVVSVIGSDVTSFAVGDRVAWPFAFSESFAEYIALPQDKIVHLPAGVDLKTGASLLTQGLAAHFLATSSFPIQPGHWALVLGVSGGVGLLLSQLIKARGGFVIGVASSEEKAAIARDIGVDHVIIGYAGFGARVRELAEGKGVHVVFDPVGKDSYTDSLDSLRPTGALVSYGFKSGFIPPVDVQELSRRGALSVVSCNLMTFINPPSEMIRRANEMLDFVLAGKMRVISGSTYSVEETEQALLELEERRNVGKVLIQL